MSEVVTKESGAPVSSPAAIESTRIEPQPSPLRVLHVHSGNIYGGVETMLLEQVRSGAACPALTSSFALCYDGRLSEELIAAGAAVHKLAEVRIRQPLSVRRARLELGSLLQAQAFDAVVTHSCWSQAIFGKVARAARVPLLFYLHDLATGRRWLERLARRTAPDLALCNSRFTCATLPKLYPRVPSEVIRCAVAPPSRSYTEAEIAATRRELQTPPDSTVIIQVSRMEGWKGHALHLEALGLLKDVPGWVCWQVGGAQTAGEKRYLQELKSKANRLGIKERVRFLGQRDDVYALLSAADIFCQPNTGPEPFGIAFIEALYSGLPVVTTKMGGALEIVDDSCGALVAAGDAIALASALRRLIRERALSLNLGSAGPARASALCDPATQMNRLRGALARLIHDRQVNA